MRARSSRKSLMARASDRRRFLESTAAWAAFVALRPALSWAASRPRTAVSLAALPADRTLFDRFQFAADSGFSGIEMPAATDLAEVERVREAARRAALRVHSVVDTASRRFPLSSDDPEVVRQGVTSLTTALRTASTWGAGAVVLAPAASAPGTSYQDAWNRSQTVIGERILPLARELDVVLAVEDLWDGFVVGPHEVARYVDAFASPFVKASFDLKQTVFYARPQDWIRVLDSRLVNVRATAVDFESEALRNALQEIAYAGWLTTATAEARGR